MFIDHYQLGWVVGQNLARSGLDERGLSKEATILADEYAIPDSEANENYYYGILDGYEDFNLGEE